MRILHLIHSLSSGGAEKMAVLLANAQTRLGHEVCLMQLTGPKTPGAMFHRRMLLPQVRHVSAGMDSGVSVRAAVRVCREIAGWRPDVVHMHSNALPYLWPRLYAALLRPRHRLIPVVWTLHNVPSRAAGGRLQRLLDYPWLRMGRVVPVTLSDTLAREYERMYGRSPKVVHNGLPGSTPTPESGEVRESMERLRHSRATRLLVHVARFHHNKRPDRLIKAFRLLKEGGADVALAIVGAGWDIPEAARMLAGAPEDVHVFGEVGNPQDYIMAADALCLSSDAEGMPLCVIEAMACGVTPVCTPVGGIPDMIEDGLTGYISTSASPEDLAEAIRRAFERPHDPARLKSCHDSHFSLRLCAERYLDIYAEAEILTKSKK